MVDWRVPNYKILRARCCVHFVLSLSRLTQIYSRCHTFCGVSVDPRDNQRAAWICAGLAYRRAPEGRETRRIRRRWGDRQESFWMKGTERDRILMEERALGAAERRVTHERLWNEKNEKTQ